MDFVRKERYSIDDLCVIMRILRGENGCPWDRVQTHESIRKNLIEETYEAVEAIDCHDPSMLKEELGDVLLQVVFHAQIEEENNSFSFADVTDEICRKLIVRHPHVFSDVRAENAEEALDNWNQIKKITKGQKTAAETLNAVPKQLPALMRSEKVQSRARKAGLDYTDASSAFRDLQSEIAELGSAMDEKNTAHIAEEIGDTLFAAVNVARLYDMDPEELLTRACEKFISRFTKVEKMADKEQIDLLHTDSSVLDRLWNEAKK